MPRKLKRHLGPEAVREGWESAGRLGRKRSENKKAQKGDQEGPRSSHFRCLPSHMGIVPEQGPKAAKEEKTADLRAKVGVACRDEAH